MREMATSGARVQLALAPAGTGKTSAMAAYARAWENSGGNVIGLAPTAAAAAALRKDLGATTDTMGKLIHTLKEQPFRKPEWFDQIGPDTVVVVDEAGMASTADLDRVIEFVLERGGNVRLVGDDQQLASVSAGGVLRDVASSAGAITLTEVVRFKDPAEGVASIACARATRPQSASTSTRGGSTSPTRLPPRNLPTGHGRATAPRASTPSCWPRPATWSAASTSAHAPTDSPWTAASPVSKPHCRTGSTARPATSSAPA
ncbi:AAA family ATPase [Rhodococcus hoagii]|nr:AAA family ATPase [Prescottella equi]